MGKEVEITVINLCYNTGKFVLDTLDCIKGQTFQDFELIIVDDCSTDDSASLLSDWITSHGSDLSIAFIKNEKNIGISRSLNKALKQAKGNYLAIIGDDLWDSTFLEQVYNVLTSAPPTICMAYSKAYVMNYYVKEKEYWLDPKVYVKESNYQEKESLFKSYKDDIYILSGRMIQQCLFYSNVFIAFSGLIKMDHLKAIGQYDEKFNIEDVPTWFSLSRKYDFLYIDRYLATWVRHDDSFTSKNKIGLHTGLVNIYLHNNDLAKDKIVKRDLNEILFHYWYKLYIDNRFPKKQLLAYTFKLMTFSGYLFRKFSVYFINKVKKEAKRKLKLSA
jgi:glycosyltransferase involved in cell wall biosynthesis